MYILPGKQFYVYIDNLTAKRVNLPKFMIVTSASCASSCIIHELNDEQCMMESGVQASKQRDSTSSVHAVHDKPPERPNEQVDRHDALIEIDEDGNVNWRDELQVPKNYVTYCHKFVKMLAQFENMWVGPSG